MCSLFVPGSPSTASLLPVQAFVASVPGKSRQSLFFGLFSFGFFDYMEGLAGVRSISLRCVGVCLACSVTHRKPLVSGNASSAALAEPVGNTFCFACRNFSGYFSFSRWPGRLLRRWKLAGGIGQLRLLLGLLGFR